VKCRVCRGPAVIDVRRQNANYCRDHFLRMCRDQVTKAIDEFVHLEGVSEKSKAKILWDNCARLYNLTGA